MRAHRTWVEINSHALATNVTSLKALLSPSARFCAVVKANAYGHGLKEVTTILTREGVDAFAVDHIDDALLLREWYPTALILVLGYTMFDRFEEALRQDIQILLYDKEGIEQAQRVGAECARPFSVHLKVETGTYRQGILMEDLPDIIRLIQRSSMIRVGGVSTHFANIEDSQNPEFATRQFMHFQQCLTLFGEGGVQPTFAHCACSAAIILYPQTHLSLVRAGISLYGLWSSELVQTTVRNQGFTCDLRPVLSWKTRIAQVKPISMGTPIGYGLSETMKRSGRIAVLPVGYWDGYSRLLSSVGEVLIKGTRCKILGRICMNMMMVDVSEVSSAKKEDEVTLLGIDGHQRISAEDLAQKSQTIHYEVVTKINPHLPRVVT